MDLLPLIVNPTPQSIPGEPTLPPSSGDARQQFQTLLPNLKLPADSTNDSPPDSDDQSEADTLAALAHISQLVGLSQIVSANHSSNTSTSTDSSLGTVVATGPTTTQIPINLPGQSGEGTGPSTPQKPLSGLILTPTAQLLQNAGLATNQNTATDQNVASNQNGNLQSSSADTSTFQIPAGFHPVPAPVAVKNGTETFSTTAPESQNGDQTALPVQNVPVSDSDNLPVQPVIATNQIVTSVEQIVPQSANDPDDGPQLNVSDVVTVATVQADTAQPTSVPVSHSQSHQVSGSNQQQVQSGTAGEHHSEEIQTLLTTQDAVRNGVQTDDTDNVPAPASQEPVVKVQAQVEPAAPVSETESASRSSGNANKPAGVNPPVQGETHLEIHATAHPTKTQPVLSAVTDTGSQPIVAEPVTTTETQTVVTQGESAVPQSAAETVASAPERRPGESRTKSQTTRTPIIPVGFALNPHHFSIQTDLKAAQADAADRAEAAGGVNSADLAGASFSTPSGVSPVPDMPETTVPVHAVRPQEVVPQLTQAIVSASNEPHAIRVELKPEELGHVRIEVQQQNGVMVASIEVERSSTAHLMADSLSQLHDSLQAAGINIERIDLSTVPPQPGGDSLNSSSQWGRSNSQASTQQEQSGSRQPPEQQQRRSEFRRDEPHRPQPTRSRNRILDIDVTV